MSLKLADKSAHKLPILTSKASFERGLLNSKNKFRKKFKKRESKKSYPKRGKGNGRK